MCFIRRATCGQAPQPDAAVATAVEDGAEDDDDDDGDDPTPRRPPPPGARRGTVVAAIVSAVSAGNAVASVASCCPTACKSTASCYGSMLAKAQKAKKNRPENRSARLSGRTPGQITRCQGRNTQSSLGTAEFIFRGYTIIGARLAQLGQ